MKKNSPEDAGKTAGHFASGGQEPEGNQRRNNGLPIPHISARSTPVRQNRKRPNLPKNECSAALLELRQRGAEHSEDEFGIGLQIALRAQGEVTSSP